MVETTWDASGWLWIRKHTTFAHGVFHDLRSSWRLFQTGKPTDMFREPVIIIIVAWDRLFSTRCCSRKVHRSNAFR